ELLRMRQTVENGHGDERLGKLALIRLQACHRSLVLRADDPQRRRTHVRGLDWRVKEHRRQPGEVERYGAAIPYRAVLRRPRARIQLAFLLRLDSRCP